MMRFAWLGLLRSVMIYYALPWRRAALRRFYRQLLPEAALVFDVGAHVGSRTRTVLSLGGRAVAVEPQPLFARWLAWMFQGNPRVEIVTAALGANEGEATMKISSRHPTVSTLSSDWISEVEHSSGFGHVSWDETVSVDVTTVDHLIQRFGQPDFIKIDVEGFEAEILRGCSVPVQLVAVEYLPAALSVLWQCIEQVEKHGNAEYNFVVGESHRFALSHWVSAAEIRKCIEEAATSGSSGDLYARRPQVIRSEWSVSERAIG